MRLAHVSDIHCTQSPLVESTRSLLGKRALGAFNYWAGRRRWHFFGVERRIEVLLEDVDAQGVDHALCTGDITSMSYEGELRRCAELYGPARLAAPARYTVLPGNHDRYTEESANDFERWFKPLFTSHEAEWGKPLPIVKKLAKGVVLVALDSARPTSLFDSSGAIGAAQLAAARTVLTDPSLEGSFVIVALHYGLLRKNGSPDRPSHGLVDYRALLDLLADERARVDLVLHGHLHGAFQLRSTRRPIGCAGSATDLHQPRCGYDLYELDPERRTFTVRRRLFDRKSGRYRDEHEGL